MSQENPAQAVAGAPVVVRSNNTLLRALLAFATIAVVGLTVAVVILATDRDEVASRSSAGPTEAIRYGGFNPATGRPDSAPMPQDSAPLAARKLDGATDGIRYDGGPEEGLHGTVSTDGPIVFRYDGGPEEGTRGPGR